MATDIVVPTLGESVTEATVANWLKAVGDAVAVDEPLVELETDKVTVEVPAQAAGVLGAIAVEVGETVEVGAVLGSIEEGAAAAAKPAPADKPAEKKPEPKKAEPAPAAAPATKVADSGPAVRKMVEERGLDGSQIPATGRDGRLTKADVQNYQPPAAAPSAKMEPVATPRELAPREERVRMTRLRQRIAERLKVAQNTAAMLTTFNEVDMSALMDLRREYRDAFEKRHGVRLGFMSFFVKAAIQALKAFPAVNAEIEGTDIIYKNHYDIGVAVSTPNGLVVPVVKDADLLSFAEVETSINDLGSRARDGKITIDELTGGTFSITNGGVFGSLNSTPIINPPQSAILGMHKIQERPMAVNGQVVIRPMMYLAVSYDHRIVDGREAVSFLVRIKEGIEDPARLLLDV